MTKPFKLSTVGPMIWPEFAGIGTLILGHLVARAIDGAYGWEKAFRRSSDYVHVLALGGAGYCMATDRAPDMSKGIFYADAGLLGSTLGDLLYEKTMGRSVAHVRARKGAEAILAGTPSNPRNLPPQLTAGQKAAIEAARARTRTQTQARGAYANDEIRA